MRRGLLLLVAIVILLTSGAPVFYIQERIGQDAKPFKLIKFRTMKGEEESPVAAAELNRITRVGRWLRRTKIDELPELLNIFVGDMSFVGPRPDVAGYADKLEGDDRVVLKLDFSFRRTDVHINGIRIDVHVDEIRRDGSVSYHVSDDLSSWEIETIPFSRSLEILCKT